MRLLLDTHALIWWVNGDDRLGVTAKAAIADEDQTVLVSAVSAMEIATKFRLGKLPSARHLAQDFESVIQEQGFEPLSISIRHARSAGNLAIAHKDPFDRLLIAQALLDELTLVSNEAVFDGYGVARLW